LRVGQVDRAMFDPAFPWRVVSAAHGQVSPWVKAIQESVAGAGQLRPLAQATRLALLSCSDER
jgi:hypothetical protein